jgi:hypothetical protein
VHEIGDWWCLQQRRRWREAATWAAALGMAMPSGTRWGKESFLRRRLGGRSHARCGCLQDEVTGVVGGRRKWHKWRRLSVGRAVEATSAWPVGVAVGMKRLGAVGIASKPVGLGMRVGNMARSWSERTGVAAMSRGDKERSVWRALAQRSDTRVRVLARWEEWPGRFRRLLDRCSGRSPILLQRLFQIIQGFSKLVQKASNWKTQKLGLPVAQNSPNLAWLQNNSKWINFLFSQLQNVSRF